MPCPDMFDYYHPGGGGGGGGGLKVYIFTYIGDKEVWATLHTADMSNISEMKNIRLLTQS